LVYVNFDKNTTVVHILVRILSSHMLQSTFKSDNIVRIPVYYILERLRHTIHYLRCS